MSLHQTEAIVINSIDFLEYDKLITLYTRQMGKVRAVVKGARKPTSKLAASIELFTHLNVTLFGKRPRELYRLTQTEIIQFHHRLRDNVDRLSYASLFIELLNRTAGENEPEPELFELSIHFLTEIETNPELISTSLIYLIKLLQIAGFAPHLAGCVVCKKPVSYQKKLQPVLFSVEKGGLVCSQCRAHGKPSALFHPISIGCLEFHHHGLVQSLPQATKLTIDRKQGKMLLDLLLNHIEYHLEGNLKSQKFFPFLNSPEIS